MAVTTTKLSLNIDSDPRFGAENINSTGSRFEINLEQPIHIPSRAFNATIRVEEATVWNTVFNVSSGLLNDHIFISDGGVITDVTVPSGTYGVAALSEAISREYVLLGGTANLVILEEDFATQRVVIIVDGVLAAAPGAFVDWTVARVNTFRDLIGIDPTVAPGFGIIPRPGATLVLTKTLADNVAAFNNIEYFKIHSDIGDGIRSNKTYDQTISRVNITAPPGSQIVHAPFNPAESEAERWVGAPRNTMTFWLTDQANNLVDTGETWSARLVFQYQVFIHPNEQAQNQTRGNQRAEKRQRLQ